MATTVRQVNAALKARGETVRFTRGRGYYYFTGDEAAGWFSSSIYVSSLDGFTVDGILAEMAYLRGRFE